MAETITIIVRFRMTADDVLQQRIRVKVTLTVEELIETIRKAMDFPPGTYRLRRINEPDGLNPKRAIGWHRIYDGEEFFFERDKHTDINELLREYTLAQKRIAVRANIRAYIQEDRGGYEHDIAWLPAIIGRRDQNDNRRNFLLAIDLSDRPSANYVSRWHAAITEENGQYFIEVLEGVRNPTYVGNTELEAGDKQAIMPGDKIRIGRIAMTFHLHG